MRMPILLLSIVNAILLYFFFYYLLYSIKRDVNLWVAALILLILLSLALITCPLVLHATGLMKMACINMPMMMQNT